jgi:hypothetical protein
VAVDPDKLAEIVRATADLYKAGEDALLRLVTRYLAQGIDTPGWALERLLALAKLRGAAEGILGRIGDELAEQVLQAVAEAYAAGGESVLEEIPRELSATAAAGPAATAVVPRSAAMDALAQALVQDIGSRHSNVLRHVMDVYRQVVAEGTAASIAGGLTRRQASQLAYARLIEQGVVSFVDARGRRWRMSSYVEMALRTVTQRAAVQGQVDKQQRLGLPYVVVSNESQECERCRPYEGRVLRIDSGPVGTVTVAHQTTGKPIRIDVKARLDDARAAGFQHPNCRHGVRSYLPGVTRLPEQPTADPDGDAARQRQRAIERTIRKWKERELGALTPEGAAQAKAKVKLWQGQMRDHLAANPTLKRLPYREQIGAGNLPAKATRPETPAAPKPAPAPKPAAVKNAKASYRDRLKTAATGEQALNAPKLSLTRPGSGLSADQREALTDYQGSDFRLINGRLHDQAAGLDTDDNPRTTEQIRHLDAAMANSTLDRDTVLHRGFRQASRTFGASAAGDLTGAEWTESAYLSTTANPDITKHFAGTRRDPVVMRVLAPRGTHGVQVSGMRDERGHEDEAEILLARDTRLRVVADYGIVNGVRRLDAEVIS